MELNEFEDFISSVNAKPKTLRPKPCEHRLKLSDTKVLLMNLNTTMTELAKSLIYKGVSLYLYDCDFKGNKQKVTKEDFTSNYYLTKDDLNKERLQVLYDRLVTLNIAITVTMLHDLNGISLIRGLTTVCLGFSDFKVMSHYEDYFTRKGIVFYCVNHSGIFGFYYNSLMSVNAKEKRRRPKEKLTAQQSFASLINSSSQTSGLSSPRNRSLSPLNNISAKSIDISSLLSQENTGRGSKVTINPLLFNKKEEAFLNQIKPNGKANYNQHKLKSNLHLQLIIYLIEIYYRKNVNHSHKESNSDKFQKKIFFINNYLSLNRLNYLIDDNTFQFTLKKFILNFNKELSPMCSSLGEVVSKEIVHSITGEQQPKTGLITFNFETEGFDYQSFLSV